MSVTEWKWWRGIKMVRFTPLQSYELPVSVKTTKIEKNISCVILGLEGKGLMVFLIDRFSQIL